MLRNRLAVASGLLILMAACNSAPDGTGTGNTGSLSNDAAITSDMASVAADGFSEDVDVMTGMDGRIGNLQTDLNGGGPGGWRPGITGCSFVGGSFTCPDTNRNGLSITRSITFLDQSGADENVYDSLLTASIHVIADISGDRSNGPWTATVARHRDFTFTGLLGTETSRTVNGTGSETVMRSRTLRNDSLRTYDITGSSVVSNVVMPVRPNGGNGYPTAGTITRTLTATIISGPDSGRTVTRTVTITFDGSAEGMAQVNGVPFTIDFPSHEVRPHS